MGTGSRCSLKYTRQLIDAIHDGSLEKTEWEEMPGFGLQMPKTQIKEVPLAILRPQEAWLQQGKTSDQFKETANMLAGLFQNNFKAYADRCSDAVNAAGPVKV